MPRPRATASCQKSRACMCSPISRLNYRQRPASISNLRHPQCMHNKLALYSGHPEADRGTKLPRAIGNKCNTKITTKLPPNNSVQLNCIPPRARIMEAKRMHCKCPLLNFNSQSIRLAAPMKMPMQGGEIPLRRQQFNESITMIGFHWRLSSGKNVRHNEWHRAKTLGAVERRLRHRLRSQLRLCPRPRPSCISRQHGNAIYKPGQEPWLTGSLNPAESAGTESAGAGAGEVLEKYQASPSPSPWPSPSGSPSKMHCLA